MIFEDEIENVDESVSEEETDDPTENKPKKFPSFLLWISFVPFLGIIFSLAAVVMSLIFKGRREGAEKGFKIGLISFAWQALFIAILYYFTFHQDGVLKEKYDTWKAEKEALETYEKMVSQLNKYVSFLSKYREENGQYPERIYFTENSITKTPELPNHPYYYERRSNLTSYYLLAVGDDKYPFTSDDILPVVTDPQEGLSIHKLSLPKKRGE